MPKLHNFRKHKNNKINSIMGKMCVCVLRRYYKLIPAIYTLGAPTVSCVKRKLRSYLI